MKISTRRGPPTPDDLDELIAKVWKEPAFFRAAIAAFGRECTRRGVPPPTINLFGTPFLTWRGLPLVPNDKLKITESTNGTGKTTILLMRTGEKIQGVVGLFQPGVPGALRALPQRLGPMTSLVPTTLPSGFSPAGFSHAAIPAAGPAGQGDTPYFLGEAGTSAAPALPSPPAALPGASVPGPLVNLAAVRPKPSQWCAPPAASLRLHSSKARLSRQTIRPKRIFARKLPAM